MAIDLEAIRRRVEELSGNKKTSNVQMWKPGIGNHEARGLPWPIANDGMPFQERWFYYIGDSFGILTPHQFGKPDPINDFIRKLYQSGKADDRALAKTLQPKMRAYMPVIVRGEEDKGVQVWVFGKPIYQRLLSFFTDSEVGDILDPVTGFDLKVAITHTPGKMFKGKPSLDTTVDAARKSSKLSADPALAKKWLESIPDLGDMYQLLSSAEIERTLNNWLNSGADVSGGSTSEGSSKGKKPTDELERLAEDVKGDKVEAKAEKVKAKPKKVVDVDDDDDAPSTSKKSLDDAFKELMDE